MFKTVWVSAVLFALVFAACSSATVSAGGLKMPGIQEEAVEPEPETAEPLSKMPEFEYRESKMPVDEQPEPPEGEKTWVWILLGFAAAVFVTSL